VRLKQPFEEEEHRSSGVQEFRILLNFGRTKLRSDKSGSKGHNPPLKFLRVAPLVR
jgi:hypothetical protein